MRSNKLNRILRKRYRRDENPKVDGSRLESTLLASYRNRYPRKRWSMNGRPVFHRSYVLMAALAVILLSIGACSIPTQYEAELGKQVSIHMDRMEPGMEIKPALDLLGSYEGVEDVNVNMRMSPDGGLIDLTLWGKNLDTEAMISDLRRDFPLFADAEITVEALNKTVDAPLFERIGHDVFGIDFEIVVDGQTEEEIRQQVLEQLYASGFEGNAQVDVHMEQEDGMEKVEIIIEADCEEDGGEQ
jgi:hypothetical protein